MNENKREKLQLIISGMMRINEGKAKKITFKFDNYKDIEIKFNKKNNEILIKGKYTKLLLDYSYKNQIDNFDQICNL